MNVFTNLHISAWRKIAITSDQQHVVDFFQFGFPTGFDGVVHSPDFTNHVSAREHLHDVTSNICTDIHHRDIPDQPFADTTKKGELIQVHATGLLMATPTSG